MQAPACQPSSHTGGSPRDPVHFFEGTEDALLFDVRCYATAASNGPIVIPVSASRPEEAAEFFRHGVRKGTKLQTSTVQTLPPRHGKDPDAQSSTTFFCDSTGVRLQGCSLYSITNCKAGLFEVPEKPSDSYLEALEILREPTSKAAKNNQNPTSSMIHDSE
ncbi:hypothetical protein VKT23_019504 [Stygiomarasmius scandens]|uniref:Uncharacterized protein n=1 Tax=Marasmiellus scandens TaxID=2682957 RepID=A0ABR1IQS8_9AGAR